MQTKTLCGMPFLVDVSTKKIYAYEKQPTEPLYLGTYDPEKETYELREDWQDAYKVKLDTYRTSLKPQSRMPTAKPTS
jgi:hypothetical protein